MKNSLVFLQQCEQDASPALHRIQLHRTKKKVIYSSRIYKILKQVSVKLNECVLLRVFWLCGELFWSFIHFPHKMYYKGNWMWKSELGRVVTHMLLYGILVFSFLDMPWWCATMASIPPKPLALYSSLSICWEQWLSWHSRSRNMDSLVVDICCSENPFA